MKKIFKTLVLAVSLATSFTAFAQDQEIRLFSHRGGRLEHDENTMYAFKKSYEAGYRGYETDVRLTADGKLVLFHDNSPYLLRAITLSLVCLISLRTLK